MGRGQASIPMASVEASSEVASLVCAVSPTKPPSLAARVDRPQAVVARARQTLMLARARSLGCLMQALYQRQPPTRVGNSCDPDRVRYSQQGSVITGLGSSSSRGRTVDDHPECARIDRSGSNRWERKDRAISESPPQPEPAFPGIGVAPFHMIASAWKPACSTSRSVPRPPTSAPRAAWWCTSQIVRAARRRSVRSRTPQSSFSRAMSMGKRSCAR